MKNKIRLAVITFAVTFVITFLINSLLTNGFEADTYISEEYQAYCEEIGEIYSVCPELLMAMIETESSGNPNATNGTCKGLMQVSEKWHMDRMKRLGVKDIYDPYGNILVATDYLMELAEKYEDIGIVLDVYNGNSKAMQNAENGILSEYAAKILGRAEMLERIHGK